MTVNLIIVENFEDLFLVRVAHDYHVVLFNEEADVVKAAYSGDRMKGQYLQAEGFTSDAIRAITKGRKKETARAYFNELRRRILRTKPTEFIRHS